MILLEPLLVHRDISYKEGSVTPVEEMLLLVLLLLLNVNLYIIYQEVFAIHVTQVPLDVNPYS